MSEDNHYGDTFYTDLEGYIYFTQKDLFAINHTGNEKYIILKYAGINEYGDDYLMKIGYFI